MAVFLSFQKPQPKTRGSRDQRTRGPEDHRTRTRTRNQRTRGPGDQGTRGPEDQGTRTSQKTRGPGDHGTRGPAQRVSQTKAEPNLGKKNPWPRESSPHPKMTWFPRRHGLEALRGFTSYHTCSFGSAALSSSSGCRLVTGHN